MQLKKLYILNKNNIYGASRLGMRKNYMALYSNVPVPYVIPAVQQNTLGNIAYEITNYLGNVNVVISDRKIWNATPSAFKACIVSRTDYFPFGMLNDTWFSGTESLSGINPDWSFSGISGEISSRTTNSDNYRFGYNGMLNDTWFSGTESLSGINPDWSFSGISGESDNETKGSGNSYTTEFRQYDPRIGRWLSLDPLMAQFPWQSPYCAFDNNPVFFTDPLGLAAEGGGKGDPEKKTQNLQEVKYVYKRTPLQKLKGFMNSIKKSLNNLSANKPAKRQESNPKVKEPSESTNPNIPDYSSIIENQKSTSRVFVYQPDEMRQKPMDDRIELSCITYKNTGEYTNPLHATMTSMVKLATGQEVTMQDAGWSVLEITPLGWLKHTKHLVPKVAKQVSKEVTEVVVVKTGTTSLRKVGDVLESIDDVMANPNLLKGKSPLEVEGILGKTPGWRIEKLGQGSQKGNGWVFRQYNAKGIATGPQLRWHPGGGHHGSSPYWRVVGPNGDRGGIIR